MPQLKGDTICNHFHNSIQQVQHTSFIKGKDNEIEFFKGAMIIHEEENRILVDIGAKTFILFEELRLNYKEFYPRVGKFSNSFQR